MQIYELRDNTIDQYIVLNPEKQIIGALAKEESYALQQRSSSNGNTPSTITPNQSNEAFNSINTSPNTTPPNSAITAVDYIGAFTYKVPTIINPLYADFKFLDFQNNPFATLNSALEKEELWKNLYDNNDNNRLGTLFKGNQLLRIPSNVFNTISISSTISVVVSVKEGSEVVTIVSNPSLTPLKTGMSLAVKSDIVLTNGDNENLFNLSSTVKIIGIGGDKIILSSPAIASSYNSESTLVFSLTDSIEKNYGKYYLKISPKYVDFEVNKIEKGIKYSLKGFKTNVSLDNLNTFTRTTVYTTSLSSDSGSTWSLWGFHAYPYLDGGLLGSLCEIRDITGKIKGQKIIGENSYSDEFNKAKITLQPDLIGVDPDTTTEETYSDLPTVGDTLRVYLKNTYFDPIFIEINYNNDFSLQDLSKFLCNDAIRDTKTGVMEIYDNTGAIINNGVVDGKVVQSYQFSLQNNLEIRHRINM